MEHLFRSATVREALASARTETRVAHLYPHPLWDGDGRIQLHVCEDPEDSSDFFVEFNEPLTTVFRTGLGRMLRRIAGEADAGKRHATETSVEVEITGFWMERPRIEEGIMKPMLVALRWRYRDEAGHPVEEGFPVAD